MGLDIAEAFMDIEDAFGVKLWGGPTLRIRTVRDLCDLVRDELGIKEPATARTWREEVEATVATTFDRHPSNRERERHLRLAFGELLPESRLPAGLVWGIWIAWGLAPPVAWAFLPGRFPLSGEGLLIMGVFWFFGLVFVACCFWVLQVVKRITPELMRRDRLVAHIIATRAGRSHELVDASTWPRGEVERVVVGILARYSALPACEIRPDHEIVTDLGLG